MSRAVSIVVELVTLRVQVTHHTTPASITASAWHPVQNNQWRLLSHVIGGSGSGG
jgi:hypothetical protein